MFICLTNWRSCCSWAHEKPAVSGTFKNSQMQIIRSKKEEENSVRQIQNQMNGVSREEKKESFICGNL